MLLQDRVANDVADGAWAMKNLEEAKLAVVSVDDPAGKLDGADA